MVILKIMNKAASRLGGRFLFTLPRRSYERMSTEEYLINTRKSLVNIQMQQGKLRPLLEASKFSNITLLPDHTADANIQLFGLP